MSGPRVRRGRQGQLDDGEAMEEVLAKATLLGRPRQIDARRGDDPDIDDLRPRAAQPPDGLVLDHLQELRLEPLGEQPHLVEKDHAAVRDLEQPRLRLAGVSEGAPLESEQFRLDERLGERRAVDVDERAVDAGPSPVDRPGEQSLAGAGLALDQDRRQTPRLGPACEEARELLSDRDHPRTLSEKLTQRVHRRVDRTPRLLLPQARRRGRRLAPSTQTVGHRGDARPHPTMEPRAGLQWAEGSAASVRATTARSPAP